MTPYRIRLSRCLLIAFLTLIPVLSAQAQATPEVGVPDSLLIAMTVDDLPVPDAEVWFYRVELEPGVQVPPQQSTGPVLLVVDSGAISLTADRPISLASGTGGDSAGSPDATGDDLILGPGEGALVNGGTTLGIGNSTNQTATLLVLSIVAPGQESDGAATPAATTAGLRVQPISMWRLALENERGIVIIERKLVPPNGSAVSSTHGGIEVGALEAGQADVIFQKGANWRRPDILAQPAGLTPAGPVPVDPGARVALTAGDGYTSVNGSLVWRAGHMEPLVVVRAQVIPMPLPS